MTGCPLIVGLEGPCCAGKTTLGRILTKHLSGDPVILVPDYSDFVGGGRFLPTPVPGSVKDEERALRRFLQIEADRTAAARRATDPSGIVLIDRSIHSLLAHCHALTLRTGTDFDAVADHLVRSSPAAVWPQLVLHLDVIPDVVTRRNHGKFPTGSIFVDPVFNRGLRAYFADLAMSRPPDVTWLDGDSDARLLADSAAAAIAAARHDLESIREGP